LPVKPSVQLCPLPGSGASCPASSSRRALILFAFDHPGSVVDNPRVDAAIIFHAHLGAVRESDALACPRAAILPRSRFWESAFVDAEQAAEHRIGGFRKALAFDLDTLVNLEVDFDRPMVCHLFFPVAALK
jgi:hypothetical protein